MGALDERSEFRTDNRHRARMEREAEAAMRNEPATLGDLVSMKKEIEELKQFIASLRGEQGIIVNGSVIIGPKMPDIRPVIPNTPSGPFYTMGDSRYGSDQPNTYTAPLSLSLAQTDTWIRGLEPINSAGVQTVGLIWTPGTRYYSISTEGTWVFTDTSAVDRGFFNTIYSGFVRPFTSDRFGIYSVGAEVAGQQLSDCTFNAS